MFIVKIEFITAKLFSHDKNTVTHIMETKYVWERTAFNRRHLTSDFIGYIYLRRCWWLSAGGLRNGI